MKKHNKFLWYWGPIIPTPFNSSFHWWSNSASLLFILPKYLKFWKKSLEFSFYLIWFGKHTVILSKINQWNLIRLSFKKSNKKEQDQANWISRELTSGHIRKKNGKSIQIYWMQLYMHHLWIRDYNLCSAIKKLNFKVQLNKTPSFVGSTKFHMVLTWKMWKIVYLFCLSKKKKEPHTLLNDFAF